MRTHMARVRKPKIGTSKSLKPPMAKFSCNWDALKDPPIMENQKMENEMETGGMWGFKELNLSNLSYYDERPMKTLYCAELSWNV